MENSYHNRDFERYLKQNSDQYRMFPSEKVWKNIHNSLHTRRRWYGIGLALLLLTTATVTGVMLIPGNKNNGNGIAKQTGTRAVLAIPASTPNSELAVNHLLPPSPERTESFTETFSRNRERETIQPVQNDPLTDIATVTFNEPSITVPAIVPTQNFQNSVVKINKAAAPVKNEQLVVANFPVIIDDNIPAPPVAEENRTSKKELTLLPLTIESVVNSYKHRSNKKKWSWQLYVTPTISYRKLSENTEFISATRYNSIVNGGGPVSPSYYTTDVNSVVNHKPDAGFKLGVTATYPLSNWLRFTTGLQFGVSKYDIKAYDHSAEVATIALTSRNTVSTVTNYRNGNGFRENWLRNFYFSASLPIGLELKVSDGDRNYFGIASTIQPTYVLDNRAWMISTDYKNYAEVPSLTRRVNLNTSFEIFSAFTTGKVKWRVAPQVTYQLMSSFVKNYPIKEHLFDFGLKLGVQLK